MDFDIISLDTETSSLDPEKGALLSLAMINFATGESISMDFCYSSLVVTPGAMRINQIDILELDSPDRTPLLEADEELFYWVKERCHSPVPMGLNIGSFDLIWIRKFLPQLGSYLGYRCLDLNSLLFAKALEEGKPLAAIKKFVFDAARMKAQEGYPDFRQHDALSDTYFNCMVLEAITGAKFGKEGK